MSVELVFEPRVDLVASTVISGEGVWDWAQAHGYSAVIDDTNTPLGILNSDLTEEEMGQAHVSLDALPEFGGRFCYRSFGKGRDREAYIANIIDMEHGSVLEHSYVSLAISGVSRSLTHELVRHRAGTDISQESQRFVDAKDIRFVVPPLILALDNEAVVEDFRGTCKLALSNYTFWQKNLSSLMCLDEPDVGFAGKLGTMARKRVLEAARSVLPNAAETRAVWTMNMRAARHICALRGAEGADLEIRRLAVVFTKLLKDVAPLIFADFDIVEGADGFPAVACAKPKI